MNARIARRLFTLCAAAMLALAAAAATSARAEEKAEPKGDDLLPLKKVVLYNAGVGFYERQAEIDGNATVDLKFNASDINDLLKSMVLEDLGGGKISTVNYASMDPITKTLKTFAIDLTGNPTMADLLSQVRGEAVEIEAPNRIAGTIVGIEKRKQQVGEKDQVIEVEYLNLLTEGGLRTFPLSSISRIKLAEPKLDAELRQALSVLALGHATDKKTVSLHFDGNGRRPVRVGYIQQSPIWKTSYRLVMADKKDDKPFLQGWALVENPTEEDWKDVRLTLVSGRPISFVMNLYQPLYVPRPLVEPELFASLRPQVYGQDMAAKDAEFFGRGAMPAAPPVAAAAEPEATADLALSQAAMGERQAGRQRQKSAQSNMSRSMHMIGGLDAEGYGGEAARASVQSAAQAGDVGELFQYAIESPVSLPRQQSAMLPIVNASVEGEKLSIYNQNVQVKHPLNGLRLKNTTGLHLMQGPITIFDGGAYAGDARIEDLPPDSERLISYALDLDVEVAPETTSAPEELTSVKIAKGTLTATRKYERTQKFTVKNSADKTKKVLVELAHQEPWKLITPKEPTEKTRDLYRFAVTAEPGKPAELKVVEEQLASQVTGLSNLPDEMIFYFQRSKSVSDAVKTALAEIVKRRQEIQGLQQKRQEQDQTINVVTQEQARIRENMARLDRNNDLYARYVKKFSQQEDQVEKAREAIAELDRQIAEKQKALDDYMLGIDLG